MLYARVPSLCLSCREAAPDIHLSTSQPLAKIRFCRGMVCIEYKHTRERIVDEYSPPGIVLHRNRVDVLIATSPTVVEK